MEEWLKRKEKTVKSIILEQKKFRFRFDEMLDAILKMWDAKSDSSLGHEIQQINGEVVSKHK